MRYAIPNSFLSLLLMANCYAQSTPPNQDEVDLTQMVQRTLQYQIMLGLELSTSFSVCLDEGLHGSWMLPQKAETEVSMKAVERVRRRLEICQAEASPETTDFRLAAGIRKEMEGRLKAAQALEHSKNVASTCLKQSQFQDAYRAGISAALPQAMNEFQWPRWLSLFERRDSILAFEKQ